MKKILSIIILGLLFSSNAYAETILLKCKFIDGKHHVYRSNVFVKTVKPTHPHFKKEFEIRLNTDLENIIEAPSYPYGGAGLDWVVWHDEYITWQGETNVAMNYDNVFSYSLERFTGILSKDHKNYIRVVKDGKFQKDANGKWVGDQQNHLTANYQCKKEDRLF